ncbi:MAG: LytTR family transcriptional regulator [Cyclobacteriaceae bacterium]|nr:LytTR family transcriptional regulator [Cyclobacteriaceae bacterium]
MQQTITHRPFEINSSLKKPELWIGIIVLAIGLSIFQDYVYSRVQNTGFYLSESLLYNSIWGFLFPLALLQIRLFKRLHFKRRFEKLGASIALGGAFTLLHIIMFSAFFVTVSYFVFSPTHHFSHIFNAALSNQFYVLVLFYVFIPLIASTVKNSNQNGQLPNEISEKINVKIGLKTIALRTEIIEFISTEKPYSKINLGGKEYLDNRTLRDLESTLNSKLFVRVHRSAIINKNFVNELKSRQNGDYDCVLKSGKTVRFSRHYRANWQDLLQ